MIKQFAAGVLSSLLFVGAASAQATAPQTSEDCIKQASELAEAVEAKDLADDKLDEVEDLLAKMEGLCEAKQWDEAMSVAKDIQKAIEAE